MTPAEWLKRLREVIPEDPGPLTVADLEREWGGKVVEERVTVEEACGGPRPNAGKVARAELVDMTDCDLCVGEHYIVECPLCGDTWDHPVYGTPKGEEPLADGPCSCGATLTVTPETHAAWCAKWGVRP